MGGFPTRPKDCYSGEARSDLAGWRRAGTECFWRRWFGVIVGLRVRPRDSATG